MTVHIAMSGKTTVAIERGEKKAASPLKKGRYLWAREGKRWRSNASMKQGCFSSSAFREKEKLDRGWRFRQGKGEVAA